MKAAQGTFAIAPLAVALDPRLGKIALRLAILMASYRNKNGECWPAVDTLAGRLGVDRRAVQRAIVELVDCGHLARSRRSAAGQDLSNSYTVLYRPIAARESAPRQRRKKRRAPETDEPEPDHHDVPEFSPAGAVEITALPDDGGRSILPPPSTRGGGESEHAGAVKSTARGAVDSCEGGRSPLPPEEESEYPNEEDDEEETRARARASSSADTDFSDEGQALLIFDEMAGRLEWPRAGRLTGKERKAMTARLRDAGGPDGWRLAMEKAERSNYLARTKPGLPFFLAEDAFAQLMRGRYDPEHDPPLRGRAAAAAAWVNMAGALRDDGPVWQGPADVAQATPDEPLPPKRRDRLAEQVRHIAQAAHVPDTDVRTVVDDWRKALMAAGLDQAAADETLTWETRRIPITSYALVALRERVAADLKRRGHAA
ncbi:MAG: hypothetical protein QOJ15_3181 [Bradyrhizobium sp.]|jgi:hypothetical protein|nr:hypothetical protein [Bradyrhizobium sp.]